MNTRQPRPAPVVTPRPGEAPGDTAARQRRALEQFRDANHREDATRPARENRTDFVPDWIR